MHLFNKPYEYFLGKKTTIQSEKTKRTAALLQYTLDHFYSSKKSKQDKNLTEQSNKK